MARVRIRVEDTGFLNTIPYRRARFAKRPLGPVRARANVSCMQVRVMINLYESFREHVEVSHVIVECIVINLVCNIPLLARTYSA